MEVYYLNYDGTKKIDFSSKEYEVSDIDVFRHEYQYVTENDCITEFKKGVQEFNLEANVIDSENKSWQELYDEMNAVFNGDILVKKPGSIHVNGSYMMCYVHASHPKEIFEDWGFQITELKIVTDKATWIEEQHIGIKPISGTEETAEDSKGYPYGYPYGYANVSKATNIKIDHYTDSDFRMIAYGPTTSVNISINGHPYHVDYPIEAGEYMVIDSRDYLPPDERIYLVRSSGERINVFNYRDPIYSVFKKIPPGNVTIYYSRNYGIDLTIFKERSEPKWK